MPNLGVAEVAMLLIMLMVLIGVIAGGVLLAKALWRR
jgi:hypothetical protein